MTKALRRARKALKEDMLMPETIIIKNKKTGKSVELKKIHNPRPTRRSKYA